MGRGPDAQELHGAGDRHATRTFLFTDIEGSTRQWEESPDMAARVLAHFSVLRDAVESAGGEVFATMGDGIAAAFVAVDAALGAAVDAQSRLPELGLDVRMGIHTGDVERVDDDYRGRPVNRAARIMAVGHGGQILLSDVSAALARGGRHDHELVDLGWHRLRDLVEPEHLWQLDHRALERSFPAVRGVDSYTNNLPAQRSTLVGRDDEVHQLTWVIRRARVVTLTGAGGVGKSRLAVHAAADLLPDLPNVWFVALDRITDADDVSDAIAATVGAAAVTDSLEAAAAMLAGERTLLVLDNCEHVIAGAAEVADVLVARCPHLTVLATSREPLGIDGEHVVPVRPLSSTSCVELFRQRAAAAGADLGATGDDAIAALCARLDGIPLAIELAAARSATLGIAATVDGLDGALNLRSASRRVADERHGTMRTTIEWSYDLLEPDERRMFVALAVFPSGFELDTAQHVGRQLGVDSADAVQHVASLVSKSMVSPETTELGVRYRMLETMRSFAFEQLDDQGTQQQALAALASWVRTITDLPFTQPCDARVERHAIRLEREADTWREAMVHAARAGDGDLAAQLCGPPVAFFLLGRHDLAGVVRPLLDIAGGDPQRRRAVLCALVVSASSTTEATQLQRWADEISAIDAVEHTGLGGLMQWFASAWQGDFARSVEVCTAASRDDAITLEARDLFLGIAILDRFSLTDATDDPDGLIARAVAAVDRSEVALTRVSCALGAAWGLATRDPDQSLRLVQRALRDIPHVPALTRLTLPGSAARLLSRLDPRIAARGLLEQLDAMPPMPARRTFVDLIPLCYGATLLERSGHDAIGAALATVSVSDVAPYLSMMDFVDLARRASLTTPPGVLGELEATVRAALQDVVDGRAGSELVDAAGS